MASSLHFPRCSSLLFPRRTQDGVKALCFQSKICVYPSSLSCSPSKWQFLRLYFRNGKKHIFALGSTAAVGPERSNMYRKSNTSIHDMTELEGQLQDLFSQVKILFDSGNNEDALNILQANYETVKEQLDDGYKGIEQAAILGTLGLGYMGVGDFKIVEDLLKLLKDITSCVENDQPLLDSVLLHMGSMFMAVGKIDDASIVYDRCLKLLEKEFGDSSPFLITPFLGKAKVFRTKGRITKAVAIYHRVIEILEKDGGMESEELAVPLFWLGDLYVSEMKGTEAETCFNRILCIYQKLYGKTDGRVGLALAALANAKCAKGEIKEAIDIYRSGIQLINESKYLNFNDDLLDKMRVDLAELLHVAGRVKEGRELLQECLLLSEKYEGIEHPKSAGHLLHLAISYTQTKDYIEAERLLRMCLHIMSKTVDLGDHAITVPMLHLAVVLYHLKKDEEAEKLALEVVRIREKLFGKESTPVAEALDCLVSIQARLEREGSDILAKLKRILSIQESEIGYESEETLTTLKKVIFYLNKLDMKDEKRLLQKRLHLLMTEFNSRIPV